MICLMYHRLFSREDYERTTGTERIFAMSVDNFDRQIAYLRDAGCRFLTPDQADSFISGDIDLSEKSVLITFDDGCESVLKYAQPILKKYGACATVFVTTDSESYVFKLNDGKDPRMTDDQLRLLDPEIISVQSHAVSHNPLRGMTEDQLRYELQNSRNQLESITDRQVRYLAIPGNWFDSKVMQIAKESGYKAVWYSNPGITKKGADPFGLPRLNVEGNLEMSQFIKSITPWGIRQRQIAISVKRLPGKILGPKYWMPLRNAIIRCIPGGYISRQRMIGAMLAIIAIVSVVLCWFIFR